MIKLRDAISPLLDSDVDRVIYGAASDIDTVAHVLGIDPHYLSVQVRIHLPFYPRDRLTAGTGIEIVREVLARLRRSLDDFSGHHVVHRRRNGIDTITEAARVKDARGVLALEAMDAAPLQRLYLGDVAPEVGFEIQREIHYIHSIRDDTFLHAGLFLEGMEGPLCYAAFSPLDRRYLLHAMAESGIASPAGFEDVAVMTRAFGYNPLPKNAMSKLFEYATRRAAGAGYKYVVTALNPLLGFKGSIFSGASFVPFATSPMRYWYNNDGLYMNRRRTTSTPVPQKLTTPSIVWLVRGLESRRQRSIDAFVGAPYEITQDEYDAK